MWDEPTLPNASRPSPGSWFARRNERRRPHPDSFMCGIRVLEGAVAGEKQRWQYRRSAVDQLMHADVLTLHHGAGNNLRLRMDIDPHWDGQGPKPRIGFRAMSAVDVESGARILVAVPPGELVRFGVNIL